MSTKLPQQAQVLVAKIKAHPARYAPDRLRAQLGASLVVQRMLKPADWQGDIADQMASLIERVATYEILLYEVEQHLMGMPNAKSERKLLNAIAVLGPFKP